MTGIYLGCGKSNERDWPNPPRIRAAAWTRDDVPGLKPTVKDPGLSADDPHPPARPIANNPRNGPDLRGEDSRLNRDRIKIRMHNSRIIFTFCQKSH